MEETGKKSNSILDQEQEHRYVRMHRNFSTRFLNNLMSANQLNL